MKLHPYLTVLAVISAACLSACASVPQPTGAAVTPAAVSLDHYSGTWLEIGRHPMMITDNCVAGFTTYLPTAMPGQINVLDGCHQDTPSGKLKTIKGQGALLDAGTTNARLKVSYPFFITFNYWVLYEAPDHSWFISADPQMKNLWIYARKAPSPEARAVMVAKAAELGYDTAQLEFPAQ
ncbi:MAG: lipocalin family protein [Asticcacaulis sp.]